MTKYEVLYIIPTILDDAAKEAEIEKYAEIVKSAGGTVDGINKWGVKRLTYPINFKNDGYYVLMTFTCGEDVPAEMERRMRLSDNVVRFMVTKCPIAAKSAKGEKAKTDKPVIAEKPVKAEKEAKKIEAEKETAEVVEATEVVEAAEVVEAEKEAEATETAEAEKAE